MTTKPPGCWPIAAGGLGLLALGIAWSVLPVAAWVESASRPIERAGAWGGVGFAVLYLLGVVLMVPGSAMTLVGGIVYGPVVGTALISAASTAGAAAAFGIARTVGRDRVRARAAADPRFAAIDCAVAKRGGWVVFWLRLSPLVPFNLLNYALGLTGVRWGPYLLASWAGMLPGTILFVTIGAGLGPKGWGTKPWAWAAVALTLATTAALSRLARSALRSAGAARGEASS